MFHKNSYLSILTLTILTLTTFLGGCQPQTVVETVIVTQEVPKEVVVTKEVVKEVEVIVTPAPAKKQTTYQRILATHKITVGSYNEIPHNWFDPSTGLFKGMNWDIMKYIMDKWGVTEINPIVADWSALIPGLLARRWDEISVGMSMTAKREEVIDFGAPEFAYGMVFIVPKGNPQNIQSTQDLVGHRVGSILGSVTYDLALAMKGVDAVPYTLHTDLITDLVAGRIDVVWASETTSGYAQVTNPQPVEFVQYKDKDFWPCATAFNPDDDDLREAWNVEILQMQKDGTMVKILENYGLSQVNIDMLATAKPMP